MKKPNFIKNTQYTMIVLYILSWHYWLLITLCYDGRNFGYQSYTMNEIKKDEILANVEKLAINDPSYVNYQKYSKVLVDSCLDNGLCAFRLYLKDIDATVYCTIDEKKTSTINLEMCASGYDIIDYYSNNIGRTSFDLYNTRNTTIFESIAIQKSFEANVLDKIGDDYSKGYFEGFTFWYIDYFFFFNYYFVWVMILIIIVEYTIFIIIHNKWGEIWLYMSLFTFVFSLYFPLFTMTNAFIYDDIQFYLILPLLFGPISFIDNNDLKILLFWLPNVLYYATTKLYLINNKIRWYLIGIAMVIILSFIFPYSFFEPSRPDCIISIKSYDMGYYLWIASYIILLIGMIFNNNCAKKEFLLLPCSSKNIRHR